MSDARWSDIEADTAGFDRAITAYRQAIDP
jgi:hypothetical protein